MTTSRRRTTLGTLSQSMANSRVSGAGSSRANRSSLGLSKGRSSLGRSSLGGRSRASVGGRRSSVYGKTGGKMQDPRPIGEKAFLQENVRLLIQFLTSHQYDRDVSPKQLSTPARKDFVYILSFLFRHIDPNFEFSTNWSDDVPIFFEAIGYPFRISKRSLLSVGSPHTWPSLLAALVWLADLVTYAEEVEMSEKTGGLEADNGSKVFYGYLANAYSKFLSGADNFSFLENDLAEQFKDKNQAVRDDVERVQAENESLKAEIQDLQEAKNDILNLKEKRASLEADNDKFEKLVADLEEYKGNICQQREARQTEYDDRLKVLESLQKEKETLQTQMDQQELSAADVQRMTQERQMLESTNAKLAAESAALKKKVWDMDMAISNRIDSVEKAIGQYNQTASSVQLIPESAKYAHGVKYELRLDSGKDTVENMLSVDLKRIVKPALLKLKESFHKTSRAQQVEKRRMNEALSHSAEMRSDKSDQVARLQSRLEKLKTSYKNQREVMDSELQKKVSTIEDLELELGHLQNSQTNALATSENELKQMEARAIQEAEMFAIEQEAIRNEVSSAMDRLAEHKMYIGSVLQELDVAADIAKQSVLS